MTPDAIKCLDVLNNLSQPNGEMCIPFRPIMGHTELDRKTVRRNVRALARKGLAAYYKGLWSEETDLPAGAGYCITRKGRMLCEEQSWMIS